MVKFLFGSGPGDGRGGSGAAAARERRRMLSNKRANKANRAVARSSSSATMTTTTTTPPPPEAAPRGLLSRSLSVLRRTSSAQSGNDTSSLSATSSTLLLQLHVRPHGASDEALAAENTSFEVLTEESQRAWQQQEEIRRQLFGDDDSIHRKLRRTGTSFSTSTTGENDDERRDGHPSVSSSSPTSVVAHHSGSHALAVDQDAKLSRFASAPTGPVSPALFETVLQDETNAAAATTAQDHPDDEGGHLESHPATRVGSFRVRVTTTIAAAADSSPPSATTPAAALPSASFVPSPSPPQVRLLPPYAPPLTPAFSLDGSSSTRTPHAANANTTTSFVPVGGAAPAQLYVTAANASRPDSPPPPPPPSLSHAPHPAVPPPFPPRSLSARVAAQLLSSRFCEAQQQLRSTQLASFDTLDTNLSPILASRPEYRLEDSLEVAEDAAAGRSTAAAVAVAAAAADASSTPSPDGTNKLVAEEKNKAEEEEATMEGAPASSHPVLQQLESIRTRVSDLLSNCQPNQASQPSTSNGGDSHQPDTDARNKSFRDMAQKSESFLMDLFYDPARSWLNCVGAGAGNHSQSSLTSKKSGNGRPFYDHEFTLQFLQRLLTDGFTLLLWQPPPSPPRTPKGGVAASPAKSTTNNDWKGRTVHLALEPGASAGDALAGEVGSGPRLEWTTVPGGYEFEITTAGVDLLDVLSIRCRRDDNGNAAAGRKDNDPILTDEEDEDDTTTCGTDDDGEDGDSQQTGTASTSLRSSVPDRGGDHGVDDPCFFTITTNQGRVHVFEAASPKERDELVSGLRNAIAWLSYHLVTGDVSASSVLYRPDNVSPDDPDPAELPVLARRPYLAMNRTAHAMLD